MNFHVGVKMFASAPCDSLISALVNSFTAKVWGLMRGAREALQRLWKVAAYFSSPSLLVTRLLRRKLNVRGDGGRQVVARAPKAVGVVRR